MSIGDYADLGAKLAAVGAEARKTGKELEQLAGAEAGASMSAADMRAKLDMMSRQLGMVRNAANDMATSIKANEMAIGAHRRQMETWGDKATAAAKSAAALSVGLSDGVDTYQNTAEQLRVLGVNTKDVGSAFGSTRTGAQKFQAGVALLGPVLQTFTTAYQTTTKILQATGWDKQIAKWGMWEKAVKAAGLAVDDLGKNMASSGAQTKMITRAMERFPEEMEKARTHEERVTLATKLLGKAAQETSKSLKNLGVSLPSEKLKETEESAKNIGLGMEQLLKTVNPLTGALYTQQEAMAILGPEVDKYVEALKAVPGATKEVDGETQILDAALGKHGKSLEAIIRLNKELKAARADETAAAEKQKVVTDQLTGAYKETFDAMAKNAGMTQEAATAYAESLLETQKWDKASKSAAESTEKAAEAMEHEGEAAEDAAESKSDLAESESDVAESAERRTSRGGGADWSALQDAGALGTMSEPTPLGEKFWEGMGREGGITPEEALADLGGGGGGGAAKDLLTAKRKKRRKRPSGFGGGGSGVYSTGAATIGLPTELRDIAGKKSYAGQQIAAWGAGGRTVQGPGSGPDMGGELSLAGGVGDAESGGDVTGGEWSRAGQSLDGAGEGLNLDALPEADSVQIQSDQALSRLASSEYGAKINERLSSPTTLLGREGGSGVSSEGMLSSDAMSAMVQNIKTPMANDATLKILQDIHLALLQDSQEIP